MALSVFCDFRSVFGGLLKIDPGNHRFEMLHLKEMDLVEGFLSQNSKHEAKGCTYIHFVHTLYRPSEENQSAEAGAPSSPKTSLLLNCRYLSGNTLANSVEQNMDGLQQQRPEFNVYHDFLASNEEENTRCKHSSFAPPSLVHPLTKILSQTSTIYFQMWCQHGRDISK